MVMNYVPRLLVFIKYLLNVKLTCTVSGTITLV